MLKLNLQLHARQAIGVYTTLKMGFETEFGKDPADLATKAVQMPFNTCGLAASQNKTDPATIRGRRDPVEPIMGNIDVSGTNGRYSIWVLVEGCHGRTGYYRGRR